VIHISVIIVRYIYTYPYPLTLY